jgi:hypothetical protein
MSDTTGLDFWNMICDSKGCELAGISFPIAGEEAECGGCGAVFSRP